MSNNPQKFTALPQVFDASTVAPSQPMEALPPGFYNVIITDGEIKPTNDGAGIRMELEWTVQDGPFAGRKVFDGLNIQNSSAKAQEISQQHLSAICHATGVIRLQDVQELFNKPHQIKVDAEAGRYVDAQTNQPLNPQPAPGSPPAAGVKYYEAKNRFRGAKAGTAAVSTATGAAAGATPAWAAPKPGTAPAAAAPAAGATPPWATGAKAPAPAAAAPAPTPAPAPAPAAAAPAGPKAASAPKGPKPKAAAERTFFVFMPDGTVKQPAVKESEVVAMLAQGMPAETMVNPGLGDDDWKTAAEYGIGAPAPAAAPAAAPAPAAATPAGAPVAPPWARQ